MDAPVTTRIIIGAPVFGPDAEQIGEIGELLIDPVQGRIVAAAIAHGGFLGLGETEEPVPWELLRWDGALKGYVTGVALGEDPEPMGGAAPA